MSSDLESALEFLQMNTYLGCEVIHTFAQQPISQTDTGLVVTIIIYDYGEQCFCAFCPSQT